MRVSCLQVVLSMIAAMAMGLMMPSCGSQSGGDTPPPAEQPGDTIGGGVDDSGDDTDTGDAGIDMSIPWRVDGVSYKAVQVLGINALQSVFEGLGVPFSDNGQTTIIPKATAFPESFTNNCVADPQPGYESFSLQGDGFAISGVCIQPLYWEMQVDFEFSYVDYLDEATGMVLNGEGFGRLMFFNAETGAINLSLTTPDGILITPRPSSTSLSSQLVKDVLVPSDAFRFVHSGGGRAGTYVYDEATGALTGIELDMGHASIQNDLGEWYTCFEPLPDDENAEQELMRCVWESTEFCDNGLDDDDDGYMDCRYFECMFTPACETNSECADGLDNDGDGRIDCADIDCTFAMHEEAVTGYTFTCEEDCLQNDDLDNDGAFGCEDLFCRNEATCQFCEGESYAHPKCYGAGQEIQPGSGVSCREYRGNDYTCRINMYEPGVHLCCAPATELNCYDAYDGDLDGVVDCADSDCATDEDCL